MLNDVSLLLLLAGCQILLVLVPDGWTQRRCRELRRAVTTLAGVQAVAALLVLARLCFGSVAGDAPLVLWDVVSFLVDGTSGLMFLLISFIGWITCQYSIRYLDGEPNQGRYFKWMSFTIGSVGSMALAADLLTFGCLWCLTSFGLHHLLLHYSERPAARRAAWTKFIVSRMGDVAVLIAICNYYPIVSSLQFADLTAAAVDPSIATLPAFQLATFALAFGVVTKSAQLPFHTWLPLTMETPTPVSALMHAGIVNAGGYLLVRSSPLLSASLAAQLLLVIVGTLTACVASMVMLTQTSIKKKLAYSTIAQMGFMLMQCSLGAYSAAMLHILAHSLYKAHEFLSSGSVLTRRAATQGALSTERRVPWYMLVSVMLGLLAMAWGMLLLVGQDPLGKPGGWLLTGLLCASLSQWMAQVLAIDRWMLVLRAGFTAVCLMATYAVSFAGIDALVSGRPGPVSYQDSIAGPAWQLLLIVAVAFSGLFVFQLALASPCAGIVFRHLQVHAANGFYIDSWLRRWYRSVET